MVHSPQLDAAYNSGTGEYEFSKNYQYVEPYVQAADLALCNVETTFGGTPYTGYPAFSSPDSMAADIRNAGFDVAITANNHMTDRGYDGVIRTQEILKENGLSVIGSVMTPDEPRYIIEDVKGVKVGIVAYTYETGIKAIEMDAVPLWVDKYYEGSDLIYTVIPLDENMEENASLQTSGHLSNAKQALEDINEILGRDSE